MKKILVVLLMLSLVGCSKPETNTYEETSCTLNDIEANIASEVTIYSEEEIIKKIAMTGSFGGEKEEIDEVFMLIKMTFAALDEFKGVSAKLSRESSKEFVVNLEVDYEKLDKKMLEEMANSQGLPFNDLTNQKLDEALEVIQEAGFQCKQ